MRIRQLLIIGIVLAFALVATRLIVLEVRTGEDEQLDQFQLNVERVSRDAASLLVLGQDYLLHDTPRAARQWHAVHASLARTLRLVSDDAADQRRDVDALSEVAAGLPDLFAAIESAAGDADRSGARPRLEMLADHLLGETRRISDGAFELAERLVEVRRAREFTQRRITQVTTAAFATLVLLIAAVVGRRVLRPMAGLERCAQALRAGELTARSGYRASDEFGDLSLTFDTMAQTLQERSASLEAARRDLQNIVDAVPSVIGYCDSTQRVRFANQACESWFGIAQARLRGMHMREVLGERYANGRPVIEAALRGEPQVFERAIPLSDGSGTRQAHGLYLPDIVAGEVRGFYVVMHDVTQQMRDKAALAAARVELQNTLDAIPSVIGYWDRDQCNRFANEAYHEWFGIERERMAGLHMSAILGDRYEESRPHIEAVLRGEPQVFERSLLRFDGAGERHSLTYYVPQVADGEVRGFYCCIHDITQQTQDRARLAAALRENEALLSTIRLHAIFSVADRAGTIIEANDNFCRITGYSREELLGHNHRIVNSGVQDRAFWVEMWRCIASGKPWRGEICNRAKDGSLYWVDSIIAPFIGADGRIEKFISIRTDITPAKVAEQRLRASEAFLERAGRVAGIGAWQYDLDTHQITWSGHMHRIHEVAPDYRPALSESLSFYAPQERAIIERAVRAAIHDGVAWDSELPLTTAAGRAIWVRVVGEPQREGGRVVRLVGSLQDISARRALETALREQNEVMSSILENLPCGLSVFNAELELVASNRAYRRLLDFPDALFEGPAPRFEDFIRHNARRGEYGPGDVETIVQGIVDRARSPAVAHRLERLRPNGVPVEIQGAPMPTGGFVTTYTDVSARKQAEALLQQAHDRFSIAADSAAIGVWEWDPAADTLVWDDRMYHLYGRERGGEFEPYTRWTDSLHADDRARVEATLHAALRGERDYDPEFRIVWPSGEVRHLKANARVVRDAGGAALRMTGVNIDITERKRAEFELVKTSSLLGTVLDSASEVSIIAVTPDGSVTLFNRGAERLLGYRGDEVVGSSQALATFHDPDELRARALELSERIGERVPSGLAAIHPAALGEAHEWHYRRKDGSRVLVSLVVTAMHDGSGTLLGYVGIAHDVTRQKEYQESLRQAMEKATHASLAKSQFLANMSHEIRTPMNAVIGLTYLLGQTALDPDQADFLGKIRVASRSLMSVINDVLDLSKIEAGELTLERAPFALRSVLHELGDMMQLQAEVKHVAFSIDMPRDLPNALEGDATRLQQMLTNLVANAIKFTDHGRVTLTVSRLDSGASSVRLRFAVKDTGIGIPAELQPKLFAPFAQADTSTTRRFGGTGLGLSIVKRVVTLMGGTVSFDSTPGVGSEFRIEVEFGAAAPESIAPLIAAARPAPAGSALNGVRILVTDDSEINLEVAKRILELEGARVWLAHNGQEAVDLLAAHRDGFDAVLMDVQMPVLDGHEATRRIRADLGLTALPVIALTAGALTSEHQRAHAAGMDDFVSKPFDAQGLVRTLLRHVGAPAAAAAASRAAAPVQHGEWPEIEGIDSADVRGRLGDDLDLFRSMLQRLLKEFAQIDCHAGSSEALAVLAARMHKLKGSASMLGAKEIARLADHAEAACRAGESVRALQWARKAGAQVERMRKRSAPVLEQMQAHADHAEVAVAGDDTALDAERVRELVELLTQQSMSAIDCFQKLAPRLRRHLGDAAYRELREQIEGLQFQQAVALLGAVEA